MVLIAAIVYMIMVIISFRIMQHHGALVDATSQDVSLNVSYIPSGKLGLIIHAY